MDEAALDRLRARLAGRSKRQLIEEMVARSPHPEATERLVFALEAYPLLSLLLARDYPTHIWLLDDGEKSSSAEILDQAARERKWHRAGISVDDCEGLTEVVGRSVVVVANWRSLLVLRHEFAHVITTFFSPSARQCLQWLYQRASERGQFVEPLASESLAEYVACGVSYLFFDDLRQELKKTDAGLLAAVSKLIDQSERLSRQLDPVGPHPADEGLRAGVLLAETDVTGTR